MSRAAAAAVLLSPLMAIPAAAGSLERVAPTADDLARELGIELTRFHVKFEKPVYCTARLSWREKGQERAMQLQTSSDGPKNEHSVLFSRKDLGVLQERVGSVTVKAARGLLDLGVSCGDEGFVYRIRNPFARIEEGQSLWTYVKRQSHEELPLNEPVEVFLMTGPWSAEEVSQESASDHHKAAAFIRLELIFTEGEPPAPEGDPVKPIPGSSADDSKSPAEAGGTAKDEPAKPQ